MVNVMVRVVPGCRVSVFTATSILVVLEGHSQNFTVPTASSFAAEEWCVVVVDLLSAAATSPVGATRPAQTRQDAAEAAAADKWAHRCAGVAAISPKLGRSACAEVGARVSRRRRE